MVVALPGTPLGIINGPFTGTLTTPNIGGGGGLFATGVANMSISFSCDRIVPGPPPPPPPPFVPANVTVTTIEHGLGGQDEDELNRVVAGPWGTFDNILITNMGNYDPFGDSDGLGVFVDTDSDGSTSAGVPHRTLFSHLEVRDSAIGYDNAGGVVELTGESPNSVPLLLTNNFAPAPQSRINPSVAAISKFFDFGGNDASVSLPIQSTIPGWKFNVLLRGAWLDSAGAGLTRQTMIGTASITGAHQLDSSTALAVGIKLGSARSSVNPGAATVDSMQVGADLAVARLLSPGLFSAGYIGYEFGAHSATVAGVDSSFGSHTFKVAGTLRGHVDFETFTLTPSIAALLQYRHRPAFTDGTGVVIGATDTIDLDVSGGATISRSFVLVDRGIVVTPFLGLNLLLDYEAVSPALPGAVIPGDLFRGQLVAGVWLGWENGATTSLQGQISRGASTTSYGLSGALNVPIN